MRVLLWHVHGSWTTAFVQGPHDYLLPVDDERSEDGLGRARTWDWPASVREVRVPDLRDVDVDVVVLQRPHEPGLVEEWLGRRPGRDVPAVYLEHNAPDGDVPLTRHPMADQAAVPVVHVTAFNDLFWDTGSARTTVVDHGVIDPGHRYTGELDRAAVVVNDPVRRGRFVGTDLLPRLVTAGPVDVFGMRVKELPAALDLDERLLTPYEDLAGQEAMHAELARRRVYVHTARWTSLGLSLIEAMHLGLPVVGLATTEAVMAVPPAAGVLSTRVDDLVAAVRTFLADPDAARAVGTEARRHALATYGLDRFLADWDRVLADAAS